MTLKFYKYQGTGNDFIMIDNREMFFKNDTKLISFLCDRKFGIGADGLILLQHSEDPEDDFKMVYFNSDGNESTMCGNGGRCLVKFAQFLEVINDKASFTAIDGKHYAIVNEHLVSLQMQDVLKVEKVNDAYFLNTGSPHHVSFIENIDHMNIKEEGAKIRYNDTYKHEGVNVNFVTSQKDYLQVRTYERGVEDETLSCGTGVTAVAIAAHKSKLVSNNKVAIVAQGGSLSVSFDEENGNYKNVWLTGPAQFVFEGTIAC